MHVKPAATLAALNRTDHSKDTYTKEIYPIWLKNSSDREHYYLQFFF